MVAILFEGKSDEKILNEICKAYDLSIENIQYFNFDGKDNIFNINHQYYDEIEKDIKEFGKIDKMLIIVDADNENDSNPNRGFKSSKLKLEEIISDLDFNIGIDYYIMCDENKNGNLESFLLSILDDEQKEYIQKFRDCYKYDLSDKWAYNTFYKQKKYPFDFQHKNFDLLKNKLINLFN
jgi:UDP-glucose 4-epimerase